MDVKSKLRSLKAQGSRESDASEAEYANAKAECLRLVEEINQALILSE